MHALVIEDDVVTAMLIEDELRDLGFTSVDTAATEEEAISAVAHRCPDLVTSDGSLLSGNGVSAVRRIRSRSAVPVLFITGDAESAKRHMPTAPVLEKPFTISQFVAAVERALQGRAVSPPCQARPLHARQCRPCPRPVAQLRSANQRSFQKPPAAMTDAERTSLCT